MAECLGLGCYFYDLGQRFTGEQHSEEKTDVRAEHDALSIALRNAGIEAAECPFNSSVTVGDICDRTVLSNNAVVNEPLVSDALLMTSIEEGVTNAA